jgi:hypothetical protein
MVHVVVYRLMQFTLLNGARKLIKTCMPRPICRTRHTQLFERNSVSRVLKGAEIKMTYLAIIKPRDS